MCRISIYSSSNRAPRWLPLRHYTHIRMKLVPRHRICVWGIITQHTTHTSIHTFVLAFFSVVAVVVGGAAAAAPSAACVIIDCSAHNHRNDIMHSVRARCVVSIAAVSCCWLPAAMHIIFRMHLCTATHIKYRNRHASSCLSIFFFGSTSHSCVVHILAWWLFAQFVFFFIFFFGCHSHAHSYRIHRFEK